ncbi:MAG: hypothetical protein ACD_5C00188G0004, partial [uncultured bacterium]
MRYKFSNSVDYFQIGIITLAVAIFVLQAIAWPLSPGRDFGSYVTYYLQMWMQELGYPRVMLHRTPIFPLYLGVFWKIGGPLMLEVLSGILFVTGILIVYKIGKHFSKISGVIAAILVLVYSAYGAIFHYVGTEFLTSVVFLYWTFLVIQLGDDFKISSYFLSGILAGLLIWIRPGNQIFIIFFLYPLFLRNVTFFTRIKASAAFIVTVVFLYTVLSSYNWLRYEHFGLASGNRGTPFYKVFTSDKLVKPGNGETSKALAELIESELLDKEPYSREGVTKESFFENPTGRKWFDILVLTERFSLPGDNPLRGIAIEAIKTNPLKYIGCNIRDLILLMCNVHQYFPVVPQKDDNAPSRPSVDLLKRNLEERLENNKDNDIAISYFEMEMYRNNDSLERIANLQGEIFESGMRLPNRSGNEFLGKVLNFSTSIFPGMFWFIIFGLVGFVIYRRKNIYPFLFMVTISILSIIISCIAVNCV